MSPPVTFSSEPVVEKRSVSPLDILVAALVDLDLANDMFARYAKGAVRGALKDRHVTRISEASDLVHPLYLVMSTVGISIDRSDNSEWNHRSSALIDELIEDAVHHLLRRRQGSPADGPLVLIGALRTDIKMVATDYIKVTIRQSFTVGMDEDEARERAKRATSPEA